MRALAQVARLGSVSRAAAALGISQPAVTQQLQALARDHGVQLLERSGRRLVPTEAGELLLGLARPLVDAMDGLDEAFRARVDALGPGRLSIAAGGIALRRLVPAALAAWTSADPVGRRLQVLHAGGDDAFTLLRDGTAALAVGSWLDVPGDIEFLPLLRSPACVVAPAGAMPSGSSFRTADLAGQVVVMPRTRRTTRQLVELGFSRAGLPPPVVHEAGDWGATLDLVALGQGISISTELALPQPPDPRLQVRLLPDHFPARPYGIATRRGRTLGPLGQDFSAALQGTLPVLGTGDDEG